jgi:hypothetical protein
MDRFLRRMRRRLRVVWAWATTAYVAPVVALAALIVVLLGWVWPWFWPEPVAGLMVPAALVIIAGWALLQRLPLPAVARAADRGLGTADSFETALQFERLEGEFGERIRARADHLAAGAEPAEAAPLRPEGRRWLLALPALLVAAALAIVPNPQDDERAARAEAEALIEATADDLDERADELEEDPTTEELAEELRQLAQELESPSGHPMENGLRFSADGTANPTFSSFDATEQAR